MNFHFRRSYCGPLQAVLFDWAGTTVDYGCFSPTAPFIRVFAAHGVTVTIEQARGPMGLMKRDHIRALTQLPEVAAQWQAVHGRPPAEADIEAMFAEFVPLQVAVLADYAAPIPGVVETVAELRRRGLKIGSTTGYTREMMEVLAPEAARRGYAPDAWVCSTDVPAGRPYPWMAFQNAMRLNVYPMEAMVKIGDTVPDIEEGLNAGMWTVGVALTGNELGLTEAEVAALSPEARRRRLTPIYQKLYQAGAHYVVDSVADCLPVLDEIEKRLASGERP
ncbi:MAG: phosphonoacetaldehyde hydrolase [Anaerolineales bacterium]|nr:phosphonoacetaldehyde hydrolase [Anaerolineales bacterium]